MIPVEFYILVSGLVGAAIGMAGMGLYFRGRITAKERESWRAASNYFKRRYHGQP